jgi:hypothetical protein
LWFEASPGKQFERPYFKKTHHRKGVDLEFKPQYCKNETKVIKIKALK